MHLRWIYTSLGMISSLEIKDASMYAITRWNSEKGSIHDTEQLDWDVTKETNENLEAIRLS